MNLWIDMVAGVRRQTLECGHTMMQMLVTLEAGSRLPEHLHPHEQITHVLSGRVRFKLDRGAETRGPERGRVDLSCRQSAAWCRGVGGIDGAGHIQPAARGFARAGSAAGLRCLRSAVGALSTIGSDRRFELLDRQIGQQEKKAPTDGCNEADQLSTPLRGFVGLNIAFDLGNLLRTARWTDPVLV